MSIQLTDETNVLLYNSVTGLPLPLETFESEDQAAAFRDFALERGLDLLRASAAQLDTLRGEFGREQSEPDPDEAYDRWRDRLAEDKA